MGDHRINVEISVVGSDGKEHKIDWWLNWEERMPARVFDGMVELARRAQLPVDCFYEDRRE